MAYHFLEVFSNTNILIFLGMLIVVLAVIGFFFHVDLDDDSDDD